MAWVGGGNSGKEDGQAFYTLCKGNKKDHTARPRTRPDEIQSLPPSSRVHSHLRRMLFSSKLYLERSLGFS